LNGAKIPAEELHLASEPLNPNQISIEYMPTLEPGKYSFLLKTEDLNGNRSDKKIQFRIGSEFTIKNITTNPNPFSDEIWFTYILTQPADEVTIKLYSTLGRLIKKLDAPNGVGYNEILWDGADKDDEEVANGVYFYKITVIFDGEIITKIGKVAKVK